MIRTCLAALAALAWLVASPASADEAIGGIKTSSGEVSIVRGSARLPATVGTAVHRDDVLVTGADGSLGVTFRDETRMSIGPNTEIALDQYVFAPAEENYSLVTRITRGTLFYVSGLIAKLSPETAKVITPGGTIGARGTSFVVRVEAG